MFRSDMHTKDDPAFLEASTCAFSLLTQLANQVSENDGGGSDAMTIALRPWSLVHGLASLVVDGAIDHFWPDEDHAELAAHILKADVESHRPAQTQAD